MVFQSMASCCFRYNRFLSFYENIVPVYGNPVLKNLNEMNVFVIKTMMYFGDASKDKKNYYAYIFNLVFHAHNILSKKIHFLFSFYWMSFLLNHWWYYFTMSCKTSQWQTRLFSSQLTLTMTKKFERKRFPFLCHINIKLLTTLFFMRAVYFKMHAIRVT